MANDQSFLGRGWAFPPSFSSGGADVQMVSGAEDVHQSLQILLATTPGQRVMQELFGCDLEGVLFEPLDQSFINAVTGMVSNAILDYEPRIDLNKLTVTETEVEGLLRISVDYTIRSTNSRYNMVYPFYLKEAAPRV
jgi:Bacteriophage baseplate protein W